MNTEFLLDLLAGTPSFRRLFESLSEGTKSIQIDGIAATAKGALAVALRRETLRPLLLITYSYEQAERLYDDIRSLGLLNSELSLVPPGDCMVYQQGECDLDVIGRRLSALSRLQAGQAGIVVAPIAAVLQRTMPPDVLSANRLRISKTDEIDLDQCARRLVALGYQRADMVERQGEFSRRGSILDVFPSTEEYPVRIDTWGDEIESLCNFDLETQRSAGERSHVDVNPAREVLLTEEISELAARALESTLESEISRFEPQKADQLSDRIQQDIIRLRNGVYFDGVDYYSPLIYHESHCLLDYLPKDALVVLDEPHQVKSHWEQLHQELLHSLSSHIERGEALRLPKDNTVDLDTAADYLRKRCQVVMPAILDRPAEYIRASEHIQLPSGPMDSFHAQMPVLVEQIKTWTAHRCRVLLLTRQPHRLVELLSEYSLSVCPPCEDGQPGIYVLDGDLRSGFKLNEERIMVLSDADVFGQKNLSRPRKAFKKGLAISSVLEINDGDYVVHVNHGIGRYAGMTKLAGSGGDRDYLLLQYAGSDKLYVPADQIDRIQKYIGGDGVDGPSLHKLGSQEWAKTTKRVKQAVMDMAKDLVALYAARQAAPGYSFGPDTPWQEEMEHAFPYDETPDQLEAIHDVKEDLEASKPMDRLVCGDVGYGKTEVAMRAIFKVVNDGKQAVVLCPTTVLAQQHFNTFSDRLAAYPVRVDMLSRFKSRQEQKKTIEDLKAGAVDIVIGTHRLLSKDAEFSDLGLVVVDEEHRFGVAHKERLKQLRTSVDVLTLTATPIPRTLHMSLSGIRDMSLINDPPEGRTPVKTYCRDYDDEVVRDAILRELDRDGQIYFVHNRIENIEHIGDHIRKLVPYARVGIGHGQMDEDELEQVMMDFYEGKYDVLLCTTIIESGLDVPNVNTIIINNADKMGLAQLYQLRGRVGRSNRQAYAYLFYEPHRIMSEVAERRLQAIREFTDLGSGFKIALRDLEIRGAGNLLGAEQHGQMAAVGFDMYCQLLSEAVSEAKGEAPEAFELPPVDLPMDAFIPTPFITNESLRLNFYKRMTAVRAARDVDALAEEMQERFGKLPHAVKNSLEILRLRLRLVGTGVSAITTDRTQAVIRFGSGVRLAPDVIIRLRKRFPGQIFQPDRIPVSAHGPKLLETLWKIVEVLPEALESSKALYMARVQ